MKAASNETVGVNHGLVMKLLESTKTRNGIRIDLYDFGGQSVFNVLHHLFLNEYGVYGVIFNMECRKVKNLEMNGAFSIQLSSRSICCTCAERY